jgi:hypothetical protein
MHTEPATAFQTVTTASAEDNVELLCRALDQYVLQYGTVLSILLAN